LLADRPAVDLVDLEGFGTIDEREWDRKAATLAGCAQSCATALVIS
jgi:hypothetical protein